MAEIPEPINNIAALIDEAQKQDLPRPHMGASLLGHKCDRWLWLSFRWAVIERFEGRMLRLFRRGQNEEATILADLEAIGVQITSTQGRVDFGSHVSGSIDAVIDGGVPGAEQARHIGEFKTHSRKSFEALLKDGVERSKPMHYIQMQVYMLGTGIKRALYVAVCKDDDRLYTERVRLDENVAKKAVDRGRRIALSDRMPEPLSTDPTWFECKWCPAYEFCHQTHLTQQINCRTCAMSTAKTDSKWRCERFGEDPPIDWQRVGCEGHVLHPDLVPWERRDGSEGAAVYLIEGREVVNGDDGYKSREILANPSACGAHIVEAAKAVFPGAEIC